MDSNSSIHLFCFVSKGGNIMNTNYKFTTRQEERPNNFAQPCPPPNYPPQFPYTPFALPAPMILQQPMTPPTYPYPLLASQMYISPQLPMTPPPTYPYTMESQMHTPYQQPINSSINNKYITNESEEFIIDPTDTKLNAFSTELTDKHICSIDFSDIKIETNINHYRIYGPLTATAYINKDGSIDFVLWDPYNDELEECYERGEEEFIDYCDSKLYKRTFTTEEIKSVGDHCMEKLLVAFMNEALTAINK